MQEGKFQTAFDAKVQALEGRKISLFRFIIAILIMATFGIKEMKEFIPAAC